MSVSDSFDNDLRKLAPKIGKAYAKRLRVLRLLPGMRQTVDLVVARESEKIGRHYTEEQILLPPPPALVANGPIHVGEVWYDGPRGPFGFERDELLKHLGICGASGSGKTTLGFQLARSLLQQDIPCVVFDVKRTWRSLAAHLDPKDVRIYTLARPEISPLYFNPLIPPENVPAKLYDQFMVGVGDEVLYGGLGSRSIMKAAMERMRHKYPIPGSENDHFTMLELSRTVQQVSGEMRQQKRTGDWSATAQRIVQELASEPLGKVINVRRNRQERDMDNAKLTIFELDLFTRDQYTWWVIAYLVREYIKRLDTRNPDKLEKMIIFEEAARIFNQPFQQPQFETILREIREKGIGICWLNQDASSVNHVAWSNTNNLIVMKQISQKDINQVGAAIAFEKTSERVYAARLGTGEAIVRLPDRHKFPFLVKTRDLPKTTVDDQEIRQTALTHMHELGAPLPQPISIPAPVPQGIKEEVQLPRIETQAPRDAGPPRGAQRSGDLVAEAWLLSEVLKGTSAQMPVTFVYQKAGGLGKSKGTRTKANLIAKGLVTEESVLQGGRWTKRLKPLPKARQWLDLHVDLLAKKPVRQETRRFGGSESSKIAEVTKRWAAARNWTLVGEEIPVAGHPGRRWDIMFTDEQGNQRPCELVSGESKLAEVRHIQQAQEAGLALLVVTKDETIRGRIMNYVNQLEVSLEGIEIRTAGELENLLKVSGASSEHDSPKKESASQAQHTKEAA
jgi:uncharacterized protein DUF87